jgi:hypothetical protein
VPEQLRVPFWFQQRQGKAEAVDADTYRLTAPNLAEAFIGIRGTPDGSWAPFLRMSKDGPDESGPYKNLVSREDAWAVAFELYRIKLVV